MALQLVNPVENVELMNKVEIVNQVEILNVPVKPAVETSKNR